MFFKKNKDREILDVLSSIENYLKNDLNSLPEFNFECDGIQKDIKNKLDSICKILNPLPSVNIKSNRIQSYECKSIFSIAIFSVLADSQTKSLLLK